jgi:hypothetical protein
LNNTFGDSEDDGGYGEVVYEQEEGEDGGLDGSEDEEVAGSGSDDGSGEEVPGLEHAGAAFRTVHEISPDSGSGVQEMNDEGMEVGTGQEPVPGMAAAAGETAATDNAEAAAAT